jgi:hypothetical protein
MSKRWIASFIVIVSMHSLAGIAFGQGNIQHEQVVVSAALSVDPHFLTKKSEPGASTVAMQQPQVNVVRAEVGKVGGAITVPKAMLMKQGSSGTTIQQVPAVRRIVTNNTNSAILAVPPEFLTKEERSK